MSLQSEEMITKDRSYKEGDKTAVLSHEPESSNAVAVGVSDDVVEKNSNECSHDLLESD